MLQYLTSALHDVRLPLRVRLWDGKQIDLGPQPMVTLVINDPTLITQMNQPSLNLLGGAYVEGRLDLQGPIDEVIEVAAALSQLFFAEADPDDLCYQPHDRSTDAAAISYHYDLSNDFYALWLDSQMIYSCAYYQTGEEDLEQAQQDKLRHLCQKLRLQPGEHLLDVGCGWGGLARFAAREFGVEVLGITLSREQLQLARQRVEEEALSQQVQLALLDYRDLPQDGRFDKVISVGMLEHVGHANLPLYCQRLSASVKAGGLVMNHGITAKHLDGRQVPLGGGDFIERYVFPDGELPHLATLTAHLSEAGLEVVDVENLRMHYARTLSQWSARLEAQLDKAAAQVTGEVLRIWRLYLAGCAYGFAHDWMRLHQILAVKPRADGSHDLPWTRADLYSGKTGA